LGSKARAAAIWQIVKNAYATIAYQFPLLNLDARAGWMRRSILASVIITVVISGFILHRAQDELVKVLAAAPISLALGVVLFFLFNLLTVSFSTYEQDHGSRRSIAKAERLAFETVSADVVQLALPSGFESVAVRYDDALYWRRPAHVADFLSWHDRDLRDAFVLGRGPLDRPKLALSTLRLDADAPLVLGGCSYFDKFCMHDSAHRLLSDVAIHTRGSRRTSLARTYEAAARGWLDREVAAGGLDIRPPPFLPNALGISGLLRVRHDSEYWWYLQERGGIEKADRGLLDNTFAGLVEIEHLLSGAPMTLKDVFRLEMYDEIARNRWQEHWQVAAIEIQARILIFERNRLYQPEFIALCTLTEPLSYRPAPMVARGVRSFPVRQAQLLDTLRSIAAGDLVQLGHQPARYAIKDNLATMVSHLVAQGDL